MATETGDEQHNKIIVAVQELIASVLRGVLPSTLMLSSLNSLKTHTHTPALSLELRCVSQQLPNLSRGPHSECKYSSAAERSQQETRTRGGCCSVSGVDSVCRVGLSLPLNTPVN